MDEYVIDCDRRVLKGGRLLAEHLHYPFGSEFDDASCVVTSARAVPTNDARGGRPREA